MQSVKSEFSREFRPLPHSRQRHHHLMKVLIDTCVLYPTVMRQMLLGAAEHGLFTPLWSDQILEEWARAARKIGPTGEAQARSEIALLKVRWDDKFRHVATFTGRAALVARSKRYPRSGCGHCQFGRRDRNPKRCRFSPQYACRRGVVTLRSRQFSVRLFSKPSRNHYRALRQGFNRGPTALRQRLDTTKTA